MGGVELADVGGDDAEDEGDVHGEPRQELLHQRLLTHRPRHRHRLQTQPHLPTLLSPGGRGALRGVGA